MKIFLDFDDVVLCTKRFMADFAQIFGSYGISKEVYKESISKMREVCDLPVGYNLDAHMKVIAQNYSQCDVVALRSEIDKFLYKANEYVHDDVAQFVADIRNWGVESNTQIEVILISFGLVPFQEDKVVNSGVLSLMDGHLIGCFDKGEEVRKLLTGDEQVWFVDDREVFVTQVKTLNPQVHTVLMLRADGRYSDTPTDNCDFVAHNLNEVAQIIKRSK